METGNTIVVIPLIMMAYVLLAAMVDGTYQPVARVSPPAKPGDAPGILAAFILLIGAVERQYVAWRVGALPPYARDIAC